MYKNLGSNQIYSSNEYGQIVNETLLKKFARKLNGFYCHFDQLKEKGDEEKNKKREEIIDGFMAFKFELYINKNEKIFALKSDIKR